MKVSSNSVQFTQSCQVQTPTLADHATPKSYVDAVDTALQANINQVDNDLTDLINNEEAARITADTTLQNNIDNLELIDLADTPATYGTAGQVLATNSGANGTEWITVSGGGGGAVDSVNSLTGAIDIVSTDTDLLTVGTNGQDIELTPIRPKTILEQVKNVSGVTLYRGTPVHVTGSVGQQAEVIAADAASNYPAHYILNEDLTNNQSGDGIVLGFIENVDLTPFGDSASNYNEGDEVYLGAAGGFTTTRPTGTNAVQHLGVILKVNVGGNQISGVLTGMGQTTGLPNLPLNHVWEGNLNGVPVAVNQNTLNVASAVNAQQATAAISSQTSLYATDAANVKVDAVGSGVFRVIVGDDAETAGAYQRLYSDVADGFIYTAAGNVVGAGAFTAVNNVTAGGALIGGSLDISGNADIDGTLTLGGIGNVEGEINQNASDIADLQAQVYSAPVTETASLTIDNGNYSTYVGKTILMNSASAMDFELDMTTAPAIGEEIYVVQFGAGTVSVLNYQGTIYSTAGTNPSTRAQYSSMVLKHVGSNNWLVIGDIE
jgi:hypothetical protein